MCHKPLTPCDGLVFCRNHYITARSLWGFLLAVISNFYRTGLGQGGISIDYQLVNIIRFFCFKASS
jgi:hypothetical protein